MAMPPKSPTKPSGARKPSPHAYAAALGKMR